MSELEALVEATYWDLVETQRREVDVDYANDLDTRVYGSGFPMLSGFNPAREPRASFSDPNYYAKSGCVLLR